MNKKDKKLIQKGLHEDEDIEDERGDHGKPGEERNARFKKRTRVRKGELG